MKILLDMNLSPAWVGALAECGIESRHWSSVGNPRASDHELLAWAKENKYIVFTHDLDFGAILAASQASFPSVIQLRTQNIDPAVSVGKLTRFLGLYQKELEKGALLTIDEPKSRIHLLPLVK